MQCSNVAVPVFMVWVFRVERLIVALVSVNQKIFTASVLTSRVGSGMVKAMDLGFLQHLLRKLAQTTRKKKEMQHSQEAMKDEKVIV